MSKTEKNSIWIEVIKGIFTLAGILITGYITLVATGVVDFPFATPKIESKLTASMNGLKTGLEELDTAIEVCAADETCYVYCRKEHPANVLHGYEVILNAKKYDTAGEPKYIKDAYASYQEAIQAANTSDMQKLYNACLIFDRTNAGDPEITQEEFDRISANAQEDVTKAIEIINSAIEEMP